MRAWSCVRVFVCTRSRTRACAHVRACVCARTRSRMCACVCVRTRILPARKLDPTSPFLRWEDLKAHRAIQLSIFVSLLIFFLNSWFRASWFSVNKKVQLDATICRHLFTAKSLYMFRASQYPSSGALKIVTATSGIGHNTGTATSFQCGLLNCNRYLWYRS